MRRRQPLPVALVSEAVAILRVLLQVALEIAAILREVVLIPIRAVLEGAEAVGKLELALWRAARPHLTRAWRRGRAALRVAEREVTPARGLAFISVVAIGLLAASQFLDYRSVGVGAPQYRGVQSIASPPQVAANDPIWAHGVALLVAAAVGLAIVIVALRGRWRIARNLIVVGLVVVVVSLVVDAPRGLDASNATAGPANTPVSIAFEGAHAGLLGAFWVQLAAGVVLALTAPFLAVALRADRRAGRVTAPLPRRRALRSSHAEGVKP